MASSPRWRLAASTRQKYNAKLVLCLETGSALTVRLPLVLNSQQLPCPRPRLRPHAMLKGLRSATITITIIMQRAWKRLDRRATWTANWWIAAAARRVPLAPNVAQASPELAMFRRITSCLHLPSAQIVCHHACFTWSWDQGLGPDSF